MSNYRDFPGTAGNNISVTDPSGIVVNAAFTLMMWMRSDVFTDTQIAVHVGGVGSSARGFYFGTYGSTGRMTLWHSGSVYAIVGAGDPNIVDTWYRVGARKAASGTSNLILTRNGSDLVTVNQDAPTEITTGDVFRCSDAIATDSGVNFNGRLAWVAWVQGVALSAAAQDAYMQDPQSLVDDYGPSGTVTANALKIFWPMQCDTATEEDLGVGNDGTRNGTVSLVTSGGPAPSTDWDPCGGGGSTGPLVGGSLVNGTLRGLLAR